MTTALNMMQEASAPALPPVTLIDLSSLFWTAWHSSAESELSAARQRTIEAVQRAINAAPGSLVAICCDVGRSFRKDMLPEYKAQRPEKDHAALAELDATKVRLKADGHLLWGAPGLEADDVIATATIAAVRRGHDVLIASADKDLLQLLRPGVRALRTHTWNIVDVDWVREKFGVDPEQLSDWLALVGDSSDNVKGAPGIGPKTATALLTKFYSLSGLWAALEKEPAKVSTPAVVKSLLANRAAVELARKIVDLRLDAPIVFDDLFQERHAAPLAEEPSMEDDPTDLAEEETTPVTPEPVQQPGPEPPQQATQQIAVVPMPTTEPVRTEFNQQLEPSSLETALRLSVRLYNSRLYSRFPSENAILAVVIRGREMGLGALTALDCFHIVEGKPCPYAYLIIARAKEDRDCEYFQLIESTATRAAWETKNRRNPKTTKFSYTIEEARTAGLLEKPRGNWNTRPADMLVKTAGVKLARVEYPGAALGLYAFEEMGGEE